MKRITLVIICFWLLGCNKEEMTVYKAYLNNPTAHKIEIRPYFGGAVSADKTVVLMSNDNKQIANGFDRGISNNGGFSSAYLDGSDSIAVIFDGIHRITHYGITPSRLASRYYLYTSRRSLNNKDSYTYTYRDLSKQKRESSYTYTFTEQDYLDAR